MHCNCQAKDECQGNVVKCEDNVRRFLGTEQHEASMGLLARDELIDRMTPLIDRIVNGKLHGWLRQEREMARQEVILKLYNPAKIRTWWDDPRESWFCTWVAAVASHVVLDIFRRDKRKREREQQLGSENDAFDNRQSPDEIEKQAEALRQRILIALSTFEWEWQLAYCMKYSHLDTRNSDLERVVNRTEKTVIERLKAINAYIKRQCDSLLSDEVAQVMLAGTRHPWDGLDHCDRAKRDRVNDAIKMMIAARSLQEQLAFYLKYSPLAASLKEITERVGEDEDTVRGWLANIDRTIIDLCQHEHC